MKTPEEALKEFGEIMDRARKAKTKTFEDPMTPAEWAESLRVVHCMSKKEFILIFGEHDGQYMWSKYVDYYEGKESDFICYLDLSNQKKLFNYVIKKMRGLL